VGEFVKTWRKAILHCSLFVWPLAIAVVVVVVVVVVARRVMLSTKF